MGKDPVSRENTEIYIIPLTTPPYGPIKYSSISKDLPVCPRRFYVVSYNIRLLGHTVPCIL